MTPDELIVNYWERTQRAAQSYIRTLPPHVDAGNLHGAAALALVNTAHHFDPDRGVPFLAFLLPRIRFAIIDALRADRTHRRHSPAPPTTFVPLDDHYELADPADVEVEALASVRRETIAKLVGGLPDRQRFVLRAYFGDGRTLLAIADNLGCTEGRVCQIKSAALRNLRATRELELV